VPYFLGHPVQWGNSDSYCNSYRRRAEGWPTHQFNVVKFAKLCLWIIHQSKYTVCK